MSSIEQQLVRDIAAVTEGVVVTDSDLREARSAVDERIVARRRRDRRRTVAAVAAAAVLVAGGVTALLTLGDDDGSVQPAGRPTPVVDPDADWLTGDAPTVQAVQGVWGLRDDDVNLWFDANGHVRFTAHGSLFAEPDGTGTYAIHGDVITITTTPHGPAGCGHDAQFVMRASLPQASRMNFVRVAPFDGCSVLPSGYARGTWEQSLPTPPDLAGVEFSKDRRFEPLTDLYNLYGVLMPQGGGHLVEIDRGSADRRGTYYVADGTGAVVDRGHWTLRHGDLTFTTRSGSRCAKGDEFVLAGVENETPGINGIRGTVQKDDCGGGWAAATFFTLAHRSFD